MSVHDTNMRTAYRVIIWEKGRGVIEDKQKVEYTIEARNLFTPKLELFPGDIVSGICLHFPIVTDVDLERRADGSVERDRSDYNSVGPCPDAPSWHPCGTPDYSPGTGRGTPDSGRFSDGRQPQDTEPTREQLLARIAELESMLVQKK